MPRNFDEPVEWPDEEYVDVNELLRQLELQESEEVYNAPSDTVTTPKRKSKQ